MILLGNCVYWTCGQPVRMAGFTVVAEPQRQRSRETREKVTKRPAPDWHPPAEHRDHSARRPSRSEWRPSIPPWQPQSCGMQAATIAAGVQEWQPGTSGTQKWAAPSRTTSRPQYPVGRRKTGPSEWPPSFTRPLTSPAQFDPDPYGHLQPIPDNHQRAGPSVEHPRSSTDHLRPALEHQSRSAAINALERAWSVLLSDVERDFEKFQAAHHYTVYNQWDDRCDGFVNAWMKVATQRLHLAQFDQPFKQRRLTKYVRGMVALLPPPPTPPAGPQ